MGFFSNPPTLNISHTGSIAGSFPESDTEDEPSDSTIEEISNALNNSSLEALQDDGQRKILDVVDDLKKIGLNNVLSLPQIVVCGDQSSGKSSVLEAITEIPFPRKENLCTRFATEIILRRGPTVHVTTTINPGKDRSDADKTALRCFSRTISDFSELPEIIEEATKLMGIEEGRAFSRDVLSVEIVGPARPQLTLVDLPGLIHAKNKSQTEEDIALIRELVEEYIENPRTIILAVISAKNDYANQIILEHCRKVDPKGTRTLGIITKPDMLRSGSENEKAWIDLAKNKDIYLELGWHMVKNRADGDLRSSFEQRNRAERSFFLREPYSQLPTGMLGIDPLRSRLSRLLKNHLKKELPELRRELELMLETTIEDLEKMGENRSTNLEQKSFLTKIAMNIQNITSAAVQGRYDHPFFGSMSCDVAVHENVHRLRAIVQYFNMEFSKQIRLFGRKTVVMTADKPDPGEFDEEADGTTVIEQLFGTAKPRSQPLSPMFPTDSKRMPSRLTKEQAIDHVCEVIKLSRGRELPGSFNPLIIGQLFREQSEPWKAIATKHVDLIARTCRTFVRLLLEHTTTKDLEKRLWAAKVESSLKEAVKAAKAELQSILNDKDRHPITYNHYYTTNIQKIRQKRQEEQLQSMVKQSMVSVDTYVPGASGVSAKLVKEKYISPVQLENAFLKQNIENDMDRFSAEEAFDSERAYYKDEMKYFINVVTKQVIERHLLDTLPNQIISPVDVSRMTEDEIDYLAAEPAEVTQRRKFLEDRKEMLEAGQTTLRFAIGK